MTIQPGYINTGFQDYSLALISTELLYKLTLSNILCYKLTLSLLGYLKTRICWGGVKLTPLSKSHVLCPNVTNDTSLESSCALLLESAKKFANLQKLNFFIAKSSYIVKMFAKKNLSKK